LVVLLAVAAVAGGPSAAAALGQVDLGLTMERTDGSVPGPVPVGGEAIFHLRVSNSGTDNVADAEVVDTFPAGLTPVAPFPAGCGVAGQVVSCDVPLFSPFDHPTFDLHARAEVSVAGQTLTNQAAVSSGQADDDSSDNAASLNVPVGPWSALSVALAAGPGPVPAGAPVTFTATVRNDGPSAAPGVRLAGVLPAGLSLRGATPSQGTCAGAACDLGPLATGAQARVELAADSAASAGGRLVAAVEASPGGPGALARAQAGIEVTPRPIEVRVGDGRPNLSVSVRGPRRVVQGAAGAWFLRVANTGSAAATGVRLRGATSPRADLVSARDTGARCGRRLPVTCDLGTLLPGETRTVALRIRPRSAGRLSVTAAAAGTRPEPTYTDNLRGSTARAAPGKARVTLRASVTPRRVSAGAPVAVVLTVRNPGPVTARRLRVCARPPAALEGIRAPGGRLAGGRACWTLASLRPGASRRFRLTGTAAASARAATAVAATVRGQNLRPAAVRR
jgi:uncharacterized repeat protein (TIGR01451 family)